MRIGLVELILILLIASLTIGPSVALWVDRWLRRANHASAAAARRRAAQEAQRAAEREEVLQRFQKLSIAFVLAAVAALVWALVLRPIAVTPVSYAAPEVSSGSTGSALEVRDADVLSVTGYRDISCIRAEDDWLYLAAQEDTRSGSAVLLRMHEDGSGLSAILTADGEITGFDFDPDGNIWYTVVTESGGALCRVQYDGWGAAAEQVVTQIDGTALHCPTAVAVGADGSVYFTDAAAISAAHGVESALRTELLAHTATGCVYVYDPSTRTVRSVLSGIAGASGLALDQTSGTLYVSDLGNRCVWAVDASARERIAGGKGCVAFASALSGYPGSLALDDEGELSVSCRWERSGWLESHTEGTFLRGVALRLSQSMQEKLFSLPAGACCAEVFQPDGQQAFSLTGKQSGSVTALCPTGNRVYLSVAGEKNLYFVRV